LPRWFEGGQTPLSQRLPKQRGFKKYFKLIANIQAVNLTDLENLTALTDGMTLTPELCYELGLCTTNQSVKLL